MTEGLPNPEIKALRQEIEDLKANSSAPQKEAQERKDILRQAVVEYWKIEYDYYKHLMTLSLASVVAFGALVTGAFSDSAAWSEPLWMRQALIALTFLALLIAVWYANGVALRARRKLLLLGQATTERELYQLLSEDQDIKLRSLLTRVAFTVGWVAFVTVAVTHTLPEVLQWLDKTLSFWEGAQHNL